MWLHRGCKRYLRWMSLWAILWLLQKRKKKRCSSSLSVIKRASQSFPITYVSLTCHMILMINSCGRHHCPNTVDFSPWYLKSLFSYQKATLFPLFITTHRKTRDSSMTNESLNSHLPTQVSHYFTRLHPTAEQCSWSASKWDHWVPQHTPHYKTVPDKALGTSCLLMLLHKRVFSIAFLLFHSQVSLAPNHRKITKRVHFYFQVQYQDLLLTTPGVQDRLRSLLSMQLNDFLAKFLSSLEVYCKYSLLRHLLEKILGERRNGSRL